EAGPLKLCAGRHRAPSSDLRFAPATFSHGGRRGAWGLSALSPPSPLVGEGSGVRGGRAIRSRNCRCAAADSIAKALRRIIKAPVLPFHFEAFMFATLHKAQADTIFALMAEYAADTNSAKIDLGVGVYKDEAGKTPIMSAVKKAEQRIL